jgi:diacylglycerol kinase (ATP)
MVMNLVIIKNLIKVIKSLGTVFRRRLQSFKYAFTGIKTLFISQPNAKIHTCATMIVCLAGVHFDLSLSEWCWIIIAIVMVWCTEALNTAIELLADAAVPKIHPLIKQAKDTAAGAVLIAAIGAMLIGTLIFGSHISILLEQ